MIRLAVVDAPREVFARVRACATDLGIEAVSAAPADANDPADRYDIVAVYGVVRDGRVRKPPEMPAAYLRVALVEGPTTPGQALAAGMDDVLHLDLPDAALSTQLGSLAELAVTRRSAASTGAPLATSWSEQKLETLGAVVGGVAHDFNNLLTTVLANAKLLERAVPSVEARGHVDRIAMAARRAARLTEELLVYAGRRRIEPVPVRVDQMVTGAVAALPSPIPDRVRLQIRVCDDLPQLEGDPDLLEAALVQLLDNAVAACLPDGGTVRLRAGALDLSDVPRGAYAARGARAGRYVFVQVTDDGRGIPPDVLPRVTDPFFTTKPNARGLGLATVLGIVRAHRGVLEIESVPGQGTQVRLSFPTERRPAAGDSGADLPVVRDRPGVTVLVCDDEPHLLATLERLLRQFDFRVLTAGSATEAREILEREAPAIDVVLYDLGLSDRPGPDALPALRSLDPTVPIVFMSGTRNVLAEPAIAADPHAEFVLKPFDPLALVQRLGDLARPRGQNR